jgi:hypothetical protein
MFTGSEGRIFVNRENLSGKPVEDLKDRPLPREAFALYDFDNRSRPERAGKIDAIVNHMGNFFDCVRSRKDPICDVETGHRSATVCHLGAIALRQAAMARATRRRHASPASPARASSAAKASRMVRVSVRTGAGCANPSHRPAKAAVASPARTPLPPIAAIQPGHRRRRAGVGAGLNPA